MLSLNKVAESPLLRLEIRGLEIKLLAGTALPSYRQRAHTSYFYEV